MVEDLSYLVPEEANSELVQILDDDSVGELSELLCGCRVGAKRDRYGGRYVADVGELSEGSLELGEFLVIL